MKKVILLILDGYGIGKKYSGNAIHLAKKPNIDFLFKKYPNTLLHASGEYVGLPVGQMGNSEVGHLNIGAGRVVYTGLSTINNAIKNNTFAKNKCFSNAFSYVKKNHSKLHLIGLVSNGGVHSSLDHLIELLKMCKTSNISTVLHIITDGRDTKPKSFLEFYQQIKKYINKKQIKIGSISGRYFAMDRDQN
jgi:2,3-bisphosphoglycerate-independent phosphoglycerate mutase